MAFAFSSTNGHHSHSPVAVGLEMESGIKKKTHSSGPNCKDRRKLVEIKPALLGSQFHAEVRRL